jgi:hypothetical protein
MTRATGLLLLAAALFGACDNDSFDNGEGGSDSSTDTTGITGGDAAGGDAAADAPKDTSITTPHFCGSVDAAFCSDFDEPDALAPWLGGLTTTGGWTAKVEADAHASPPNGFEVDTLPQMGSAFLDDMVGNPVDAGATISAVLDLDMFIPSLLNQAFPPIMLFDFGCILGGDTTRFGLSFGSAQWALVSRQNGPIASFTGTVPTGQWSHITLTVDLSQSGSVKIDIGNGAATATATGINTIGSLSPTYPIAVELGASAPSATYQTSFEYDNVVVHLQ